MAKIDSDIVNRLCAISEADTVDWGAFDKLLDTIPDINAIDEEDWEETYLSSCIENAAFYHSGEKLVEICRRFLAKGYDVKANEGKNGGLCLSKLCWASYDQFIIDVAKVLLSAGAPIDYPSIDDEPGEITGVMGDIEWKISGAWVVDKDYSWANTLETYYQIVKAIEDGEPYELITTYHTCIGKQLDSVELLDGDNIQMDETGVSRFDASLIFWFDGTPLIVSKYIELVVNPYTADNNVDRFDVSTSFSSLVGASLQKITYLNQSTCYLQFNNGRRLILTSIDACSGNRERAGLFEIRNADSIDLKSINIDAICFWNHCTYAECVTEYEEEVLALIKDTEVILVYTIENEVGENYIEAISCSLNLVKEYNQKLPINEPTDLEQFHYAKGLKALRFKCGDYFLYAQAHEYCGFEVKLSEQKVSIEEPTLLRRISGIHMKLITRQ